MAEELYLAEESRNSYAETPNHSSAGKDVTQKKERIQLY